MRAMSLRAYIEALQSGGRYTFIKAEALMATSSTEVALKLAVARLAASKRVVAPCRGFFVIVPPEYRAAGSPPGSWFIDDLMKHLRRPYYVGLLSAAALHGAGHQQPQEFQVVTDRPLRRIEVGRVRIRFIVKRRVRAASVNEVKTETGIMRVSTPETTALDLACYVQQAGGLGNVATVLGELAEHIEPSRLAKAAQQERQLSHVQRLGFLLERAGRAERAVLLASLVDSRKPRNVPLRPARSTGQVLVDQRWHVAVNEEIEADL
jgi:predicted transcriptional regulator of viral defense system